VRSVESYNKCSKCSLSALTQVHNRFATCLFVYCPVDNTLFEVSSEIRGSGVSSPYCCYGNHAAGSKTSLKNVLLHQYLRIEPGQSLPKMISKCCDLVKLRHLIVAVRFLETHCRQIHKMTYRVAQKSGATWFNSSQLQNSSINLYNMFGIFQ